MHPHTLSGTSNPNPKPPDPRPPDTTTQRSFMAALTGDAEGEALSPRAAKKVTYERCPRYCVQCRHLGHDASECRDRKDRDATVVKSGPSLQTEDLRVLLNKKKDQGVQVNRSEGHANHEDPEKAASAVRVSVNGAQASGKSAMEGGVRIEGARDFDESNDEEDSMSSLEMAASGEGEDAVHAIGNYLASDAAPDDNSQVQGEEFQPQAEGGPPKWTQLAIYGTEYAQCSKVGRTDIWLFMR
ncbi:hypothetical protein Salat_1677300 [Sesamum alatum]|uniref:Uncharacterized protein n=1 Tax=Sesamum alatum TaxID=300844 RepID=A0AAE1Y7E7_9LAMI|nr:hypothetical protein Salat_1677300 [Sesamum alatum]